MYLYPYEHEDAEREGARRGEILRPLLRSAARWAAFYAFLAALIVVSDHVTVTVPVVWDLSAR